METKAELRSRMKARLGAQTPEDRRSKSAAIAEKLFASEAFRRADTVAFFASLPAEVDTAPMIDRSLAAGKRVLLPKTDLAARRVDLYEIRNRATDLEPGALGIPEPRPGRLRAASVAEAALILVPGLCFDRRNNRLGFGAGIYDRFLASAPHGTPKVGLAFAFQVLDEIPVEPHDVPLDLILTEE
ncbi:MAG TPA: 5-formyltetrahydrofolate cyclo-ligase [Candidatus Eisenbacteria bacterium]|nr:5-formyltetrahydrofolate cyclo-ligase [Candidatus Eisenbacteria bacterium]